MAVNPWKVPAEVYDLAMELIVKDHSPRLAAASIVVCFDDSKPFVRNKLNLGKVTKFSPVAKLWQDKPHDFCLIVCAELWHSVLKGQQRAAYLDLQLSRCGVEYLPETVEINGKKQVVKDDWGRTQYTETMKTDDDGLPKWKVHPLDLEVVSLNVARYGLWCESLLELKHAIEKSPVFEGEAV